MHTPNLSKLCIDTSIKRQRSDNVLLSLAYEPRWYATSSRTEFTMTVSNQDQMVDMWTIEPWSDKGIWSNPKYLTTINMKPCPDQCIVASADIWCVTPWTINEANQQEGQIQKNIDAWNVELGMASQWRTDTFAWYQAYEDAYYGRVLHSFMKLKDGNDFGVENFESMENVTVYFWDYPDKLRSLVTRAIDQHPELKTELENGLFDVDNEWDKWDDGSNNAILTILDTIYHANGASMGLDPDISTPDSMPKLPSVPRIPYNVVAEFRTSGLENDGQFYDFMDIDAPGTTNFDEIYDRSIASVTSWRDTEVKRLQEVHGVNERNEFFFMKYIGLSIKRVTPPLLLIAFVKLDAQPSAMGFLLVEGSVISDSDVLPLMEAYPWSN